MAWVIYYPCPSHPSSAPHEHWVTAHPGLLPSLLGDTDGRHTICSTEGMMFKRAPLNADSSLTFLARARVPSASDGLLTAWALLALALVVAALLIGAR